MEHKPKNERDSATKNDNIIRETFQKLAQVILQARIVFPITPPSEKRINKWVCVIREVGEGFPQILGPNQVILNLKKRNNNYLLN
jgi:hypothetical protein